MWFPTDHAFFISKVSAKVFCQLQVRLDGQFRKQNSCARFPDSNFSVVHCERGKLLPEFFRSQELMRKAMLLRATDCTAHENAVLGSDHESACLKKQILARLFFDLVPKFVSALHERDVIGMFEISFPNDSRFAVR